MLIKPDLEAQGFWAQAALGAGFKGVLFTDIRGPRDVDECYRVIRPDHPGKNGAMGVKLRRPALASYDTASYLEDLQSMVFAVMIEKNVAVESLDEVLAQAREKGVDLVQWGPADFTFSRGVTRLPAEEIRSIEERVIAKSLEYGLRPRAEIGAVEQAQRYLDLGVRDFCIGWDRFVLRGALQQIGEGMAKLLDGA